MPNISKNIVNFVFSDVMTGEHLDKRGGDRKT